MSPGNREQGTGNGEQGTAFRALSTERGFSLLEVMVALAIMVIILASTYFAQSSSLASSGRNRNVIIATNLARNLINEEEVKIEGQALEKLAKTTSADFPEPNQNFKYTIAYEEVDFSALTDMLTKQAQAEAEKAGKTGDGMDGQTETILKIFKDYLKKAVRRMTVTIEWKEGEGTSSQTFTQLIVNYDTELSLAI